jgi:hypothetical protein
MVSCGYEPTAVIDGFYSLKGLWAMAKGNFSLYKNEHALKQLNEWPSHAPASLVQIAESARATEEINV